MERYGRVLSDFWQSLIVGSVEIEEYDIEVPSDQLKGDFMRDLPIVYSSTPGRRRNAGLVDSGQALIGSQKPLYYSAAGPPVEMGKRWIELNQER